ncbi:malto-oligosyltrehalose synthase [Methylotetracoccus oryzae]|uniref:malto-oligosyltrehalose synthase n=1 Tax=Methylotetracoccus oryzae TaxID=1919059 RepID=UPI0013A577CF|nr:malto-oligosyltrehalose synthase [Methylotetracoccus oryzae]
MSSDLDRLCALAGVATELAGSPGETVPVADEIKRAVLAAMGFSAEGDAELREICETWENRSWLRLVDIVRVQSVSDPACTIPISLAASLQDTALDWTLDLESGERFSGRCIAASLPRLAQRSIDGVDYLRMKLDLPHLPPCGYHRVCVALQGGEPRATQSLIVVPEKAYRPAALQDARRIWGVSVPLYGVRSVRNWGVGDFTDLSSLVDFAAEKGADLVSVTPLHALWPGDPERCDPFQPSSRLLTNILYVDVEAVPEFADCEAARTAVFAPEFQARLRALRGADLVDYRSVTQTKLEVLEALFAHFRKSRDRRGMDRSEAFRTFQDNAGVELERQCVFDALSEHWARGGEAGPAPAAWPDAYRRADSSEVKAFAEANRERVEFFAYLYWQADLQLEAVGRRCLQQGLGVGLSLDFSLRPAACGAEAWASPSLYAPRLRLGFPRDLKGAEQAVGEAAPAKPAVLREQAYVPLITALRNAMRHCGALLLQPAGDLFRQYCRPCAADFPGGTYVTQPTLELLGIIALESHRNQCLIGVGDGLECLAPVAELQDRGLLTVGSLLGELRCADRDGEPDCSAARVIVTASPGEPPLCGFWLGTDLDELGSLGLFHDDAARVQEISARALQRARLLARLDERRLLPPEITLDPISAPDMTQALVRAVYRLLAEFPAAALLVNPEDLFSQRERAFLPGAPPDYPNWRRKLRLDLDDWRKEAQFDALATVFSELDRSARVSHQPQASASPRVRYSIPEATYRLQFNRDFTFRQAAELLPYLSEIGISHCYASPYLKARPGSRHGYDIVDHGAVNPEIGSPEEFEHFLSELDRFGIGQIIDLVPNHMGVMGSDNRWWMDVLENGPASDFANFFDIEWSPISENLRGKVLLPALGLPYGIALEAGEIQLTFDGETGHFDFLYGEHRFPVDPREYPVILGYRLDQLEAAVGVEHRPLIELQSLITAFGHLPARSELSPGAREERHRDKEVHKGHLAALCRASPDIAQFIGRDLELFNGIPGVPASFELMHELLERQAYRLAYWRVAADDINYRRFFDINDLAGLCTEHGAVFDATHRFVLNLIAGGKVSGLRIDHPDGLYDPQGYLETLQHRIAELAGAPEAAGQGAEGAEASIPRFFVVAEKILACDEPLPATWPVHGTTGYDFLRQLNELFICPGGEAAFSDLWAVFADGETNFDQLVYRSKRMILRVALSSELTVLANQLSRIAEADRTTRDFTLNSLRDALREIISCFPVYRSYVRDRDIAASDIAAIERAVAGAKRCSRADDISVFDFIRDVLLTRQAEGKPEAYQTATVAFAMSFQQLTGPVMAKGVEDTAFYRYHRFVSLNEVGGDPRRFGCTVADFHRANQSRAEHWPHSLLATSTHDTKRSEDVRARLNVLSELGDEWRDRVNGWRELNRPLHRLIAQDPAPHPSDEYLIYQTLVGTWPLGGVQVDKLQDYRGRVDAYLLKAMREAKRFTSWLNPNDDYEEATLGFLGSLLCGAEADAFRRDFESFVAGLVRPGLFNSLSQLLLKLTVPGVPDIYQGQELWDFSLVDPDNRRSVDYALRQQLLDEQRSWDTLSPDALGPRLTQMQDLMEDGRIKLYVTRRALRLRLSDPELFKHADYQPVFVEGQRSHHVCAFSRTYQQRMIWVAVPRWTRSLLGRGGTLNDPEIWSDTFIPWPRSALGVFRDVFTGRRFGIRIAGRVPAAKIFAAFPVALWIQEG